MKYIITIDQRAIIESGLQIDFCDAAILDFIVHWVTSAQATTVDFEGRRYVWISHSIIASQLPMLGVWKDGHLKTIKKDTVYRRMKNLCDVGLLELHPNSKELAMSLYALTELFDSLRFSCLHPYGKKSDPTEKNPYPLRKKIRSPTEKNPVYKNIDYKNIDYIKKEKEEKEINSFSSDPLIFSETELSLKAETKTEKKKVALKNKTGGFDKVWPASFTDEVIIEMEQYLKMRKQIKKNLKTQRGFTRLVNECEKILNEFGMDILLNSIKESTDKEWQSVYAKPIKNNNHGNHKQETWGDWLKRAGDGK